MSETLFRLENVSYSYLNKFPGLNNINLEIKQGENVTILGSNGSGKSTLIQILAGLFFAQKGTVQAFGRNLTQNVFDDDNFRKLFRSKVGIVFQNSEVQLFSPTVEEELYFGPLQLEKPVEEIKKSVSHFSNLLGIEKLFSRSPNHLSVGEKKKVALASVLAIEPEVLLLDEPTAGLDPRTTSELIDLILHYHNLGKTVITATHDLHVVSEIATRIYILNEEKTICASGDCADILLNQELLIKYNLAHIHTHKHGAQWHKHIHNIGQHDHKR
ncbi:MAG: ABC transporter ATP-binding protein [Candidatus Omnitrophota bacterium]